MARNYKDRFNNNFHDMSDNIGNHDVGPVSNDFVGPPTPPRGHILHWHSIATGVNVHFKAFLTQFSDRYESEWNDEETYGRMDPISTFKRTKRTISLAWDVPAASVDEAKHNLEQAELFLSMLYPVYEAVDVRLLNEKNQVTIDNLSSGLIESGAEQNVRENIVNSVESALFDQQRVEGTGPKVGVMVAPPLFKLKFSNLIIDNGVVSIQSSVESAGLVGKLSGLSYEPDIEQGFFGHEVADGLPPGVLIPQTIKFSCDFTVLHTSPLGWDKDSKIRRSPGFYHAKDVGGE